MNVWKKIVEAQSKRQEQTSYIEDGQEVQIRIRQNGWYEGFVSMS